MAIETVGELIEYLERYDENLPVRIAHQPSWPLAAEVANVREIDSSEEVEGEASERTVEQPGASVVWIAATAGVSSYGEHPYAPRQAWEEV